MVSITKKQATFALIVLALIVMSHNISSYFISGGIKVSIDVWLLKKQTCVFSSIDYEFW